MILCRLFTFLGLSCDGIWNQLLIPLYFLAIKPDTEDFDEKPICVGPWGGPEGEGWDDGVYNSIRQLRIANGAGIVSIQIEYNQEGSYKWSAKHGGLGGTRSNTIKLESNEFLMSIHGYYGTISQWSPTFIRSLSFQSNKRAYGPFGVEEGTRFSFSKEGGKISGFHGRSGWYLEAIGVYLKPQQDVTISKSVVPLQAWIPKSLRLEEDDKVSLVRSLTKNKVSWNVEGLVSYGPWGGSRGSIVDDGMYTGGIREINLTRSKGINTMRVFYDQNGQGVWGSKLGGIRGTISEKIKLDYPDEILTHISGYYGPLMYMGPKVIRSLTFHTTKNKHGPYGDEKGTPFNSNLKEGMIVGFFGRGAWFIDSIGVHVIERQIISTTSSQIVVRGHEFQVAEVAKKGSNVEITYGVVNELVPIELGPWGGNKGKPWDDGVFTGIKQILLITRSEAISSVQIEYDQNGQSVWSARHGGYGDIAHKVKFEYPHEVVIFICGYYGPVDQDDQLKVIRSLTFYTSRGKYGPFGKEIGTYFTSITTKGTVVGFHGRSSLYLDGIGVHMQQWLGNQGRSTNKVLVVVDGSTVAAVKDMY